MVVIQVYDRRDGKPAANKSVTVSFGVIGGGVRDSRTDERGLAYFDIKPGRGKVWIGSEMVLDGELSSYLTFYV